MDKFSREEKLKLRVKMVDSANKIGISETARLFKVNRNTVSHWVKRYREEGTAGLQNRSKKGVKYPNKMPLELEKKIISYKKKNPNVTATKIIEDLELEYSVSIVVKKLKNAGLWQQQKVRLKLNERFAIEPYRLILISISKLDFSNHKKIPGYYLTACDFRTRYTWHSFSYDNYEPSIAAFCEHILHNLKQKKIDTQAVELVPLKKSIISYSKRKKSAINSILANYKSKLKYINDEKRKDFLGFIKLDNFRSWLEKENFLNLPDLLAKSYIYCLGENLRISKEIKSVQIKPRQIDPMHIDPMQIEPMQIEPRVISYRSLDTPLENIQQNREEIFIRSLNFIQTFVKQSLSESNYYKAVDYLDVLLSLIEGDTKYEKLIIESLIQKGRLLKNCGSLELTKTVLLKAEKYANSSKNKQLQTKSSFALAEFYRDTENTTLSMQYLETALKQSKAAADKYMEAKTAISLALLNLKTGQPRKTLGLLLFYLKKAKALDNKPLIVDFYMGMARYYNHKGDEIKVSKYLNKAEVLAEEIAEPEALFKVYYPLLSMSFKSSMPMEFITTYRDKMKNLIPKLKNQLKRLNALNSVGCAEINLNNHDEALKIFLEQLQIAEKLGLKFMICSALINIGNRFMNVGKNSNALNYLIKAYKISGEIQFYEGIYSSCINISSIYSNQGEFDDSLEYIGKGLLLAQRMGNRYYQTGFLLSEGAMLLEKKQPEIALTKFKKALKLSRETGNKPHLATAYNNLSVALNDLGKVKPALQNIEKALNLVMIYKSKYHNCLFKFNKARYLFKNDQFNKALELITEAEDLAKVLKNRYVITKGAKLREKILEKLESSRLEKNLTK